VGTWDPSVTHARLRPKGRVPVSKVGGDPSSSCVSAFA
jgi:hypothetical protein